MARRRPFARGLQHRRALLAVRPEGMIGDRDADAVGGRREVVAGVEHPVPPVLERHEWAFDQVALPIEVVGQHDPVFPRERTGVGREALRVDRGRHCIDDSRRQSAFRQPGFGASPIGTHCLDQRLHDEETDHRALDIGPADDRGGEGSGSPVLLTFEEPFDQVRMLTQQSGEGPRPDAVRIVLPEEVRIAASRIDEDMGVHHPAAHLRRGWVEPEPGCVQRLAGDQRRAIVEPRADRTCAPGDPDRQRVRSLPSRVSEPIFVADPGHFRRPEIRDVASLGRPRRLLALVEDEASRLPML